MGHNPKMTLQNGFDRVETTILNADNKTIEIHTVVRI